MQKVMMQLKRFVPVYRSGNRICIGFKGEKYFEIQYNEKNYLTLKYIIEEGIESKNIKSKNLYIELSKANLLKEVQSKEHIKRNDLFLEYISEEKINTSFKNKKILIFGAGAGGSTLTYLLAQFGFKNLVIIDGDIVTKSDIDKLLIFDKKNINQRKVDALNEKIKENFQISISTHNAFLFEEIDLRNIVIDENPDLVVQACDPNLGFRSNLNKVCFNIGVPYFTIAYAFEFLKVGPLYVPGFTSCDNAINNYYKKEFGDHYDFTKNERLFTKNLVHPSVSFNINILSSFALKEIIFFLSQQYEFCFSIGKLLYFNPLNLYFNHLNVECDDSCTICK
ncbi:ThiF family adenylyltransferase [Nostoc sp. CHAB 5834]|nr:ThiF family adenylyltransferase [Nostoc sp. CHAB 5834]